MISNSFNGITSSRVDPALVGAARSFQVVADAHNVDIFSTSEALVEQMLKWKPGVRLTENRIAKRYWDLIVDNAIVHRAKWAVLDEGFRYEELLSEKSQLLRSFLNLLEIQARIDALVAKNKLG